MYQSFRQASSLLCSLVPTASSPLNDRSALTRMTQEASVHAQARFRLKLTRVQVMKRLLLLGPSLTCCARRVDHVLLRRRIIRLLRLRRVRLVFHRLVLLLSLLVVAAAGQRRLECHQSGLLLVLA